MKSISFRWYIVHVVNVQCTKYKTYPFNIPVQIKVFCTNKSVFIFTEDSITSITYITICAYVDIKHLRN